MANFVDIVVDSRVWLLSELMKRGSAGDVEAPAVVADYIRSWVLQNVIDQIVGDKEWRLLFVHQI